jgi:hypothetical protein
MMQSIAPAVRSCCVFTPLVEVIRKFLGEARSFQPHAGNAAGSLPHIFLDNSLFL